MGDDQTSTSKDSENHRSRKGKEKAVNDPSVSDVEEIGGDRSQAFKLRTEKGWETRRARRRLLAEREDIDPFLDGQGGPSVYPDLPSNDLLTTLHHHASSFYTTHNLMIPPRDRAPRPQWASKKRQIIDEEGVNHSRSVSLSLLNEEAEEDENAEGDNDRSVKQEIVVDQYGERRIRNQQRKKGRPKGRKGEYRKRDMTSSLDGTALLALGVLVQQYIIEQLFKAGYRHEDAGADADAIVVEGERILAEDVGPVRNGEEDEEAEDFASTTNESTNERSKAEPAHQRKSTTKRRKRKGLEQE